LNVYVSKIEHTSFSFCRSRTLGAWGAGLGIIFLYLTDWKVVMGRIPYVKGRFRQVEDK
jgi:hypothetical protein